MEWLLIIPALILFFSPIVCVFLILGMRSNLENLKYDQKYILRRLDAISDTLKHEVSAEKSPYFTEHDKADSVTTDASVESAQVPAPDLTQALAGGNKPSVAPPPLPLKSAACTPPSPPVERVATVHVSPPPSIFAEKVRYVLHGIWNWILVGEEHRPSNVTAEFAIASVWLLRVGIVTVVTGVVYFLKLSIARGWVGEEARVAISMLTGIGMILFGLKIVGRKYNLIGQGLLGGGIVTLYFSAFAVAPMFGLIPIWAAFLLMIIVTVAAVLLAIKTDSMLIAVLGIVGGYMTPVLLRTETPNLPVIYSYMLLLSLGVLGVAYRKQWRLMNYLAFIFTYLLYLFSLLNWYEVSHDFPLAITFGSLFFVVHSSMVYINNILRNERSTVLEVIHTVINTVVYAVIAYLLICDAYAPRYSAVMTLGIAMFFTLHVAVFIKRNIVDRALLLTLIALTGVFTVITLPIVFERETLTISFALIALMFVWLGHRMRSNFLQNMGYVVYFIVFGRLLLLDIPRNFGGTPDKLPPMAFYWQCMFERFWTFGVSIASIAAAFWLQRGQSRQKGTFVINAENDISALGFHNVANQAFYWFGIIFTFLFLQFEFSNMFRYFEPMRLPMLTLLWCLMGGYFLWKSISGDRVSKIFIAALSMFLSLTIIKLLGLDLMSWHITTDLTYSSDGGLLDAAARFVDFGALLILLTVSWRLLRKSAEVRAVSWVFGYMAFILLFIYATLELNSLLHWKLPEFRAGGISILWALFAIVSVGAGIRNTVRSLRYVGLILFCIVAIKVFAHDLSDMDILYRVIASVVVGIALLLASFAYLYSRGKFSHEKEINNGGEHE